MRVRVLGEMTLFFFAFFLPGYVSQGSIGALAGPLTDSLMVQSLLTGIPQVLLMLYVVIVAAGTPPSRWGIVPLSARDVLRTGILLAACFAVVAPFIAVLLSLPPEATRRISQGFRWRLSSPSQIPLALLFGLTAGYREEFFFRSYLLGRLEETGVPMTLSVALSTMLFCAGHLYEGILAVGITAALGLLMATAWLHGRSLHVVAIAHGAYNTLVLCLGLFLPRTLPDPATMHIF